MSKQRVICPKRKQKNCPNKPGYRMKCPHTTPHERESNCSGTACGKGCVPVKNENPVRKREHMYAVMELISEFTVNGWVPTSLPKDVSGFIIVYKTRKAAKQKRQSNTAEILPVQFSKATTKVRKPPVEMPENTTMVCSGKPECKRRDCFHSKPHSVRYDCSTFNAKCPHCLPLKEKKTDFHSTQDKKVCNSGATLRRTFGMPL
jgi:hypothetical protein